MQTVYVETSILSYLTARPSSDIRAASWQLITKQWWNEERNKFKLFISELVIEEVSKGNSEAAQRRLNSLENIAKLSIEPKTADFVRMLTDRGGVPQKAEADALHIAICAVHGIDYLLTWNCTHINNAVQKPIIRKICEDLGYKYPEICTPQELITKE